MKQSTRITSICSFWCDCYSQYSHQHESL